MTIFTVLACLAYLGWLVVEHRRARQDRQALPHVVHVNGIRGKSSVCRLIDAGLRAGGLAVLTKTTGTRPIVRQVDGSERPVRRRGPPSIKEQLAILQLAARQQADVLVVECMAVLPEYQQISETRMLRSDIGVITNVRPDHPEEMGHTLAEIAAALSQTIPADGTLFTADHSYHDYFSGIAATRGTSVVLAGATEADAGDTDGLPDFADNVRLALAVCVHLGVPEERALAGMQAYRRDPGVFHAETVTGADGATRTLLNALAANDPDSAARLLDLAEARGWMDTGPRLLLLNNRYDRPARTLQFIDFAVRHEQRFDGFLIAGSPRPLVRRALLKRGIDARRLSTLRDFPALDQLPENAVVFAVGNIVGSGHDRSADPPAATGTQRNPDVR